MRALPNTTVVGLDDPEEIAQVVPAIADMPGPVYLRLKRGEIPTAERHLGGARPGDRERPGRPFDPAA
ncbi:hypothetical protein AB0D40_40420 [Streptomyces massasporeus]|jgi:transketolase C-terminal domain/subunit|uniref:hypothetical protein n=1 Tax=Streptomyces massasporeus TaxID=67324 RepID=UPI0034050C31